MSVVDAQTARAMAQKIQRATPGINYAFFDQHPLLKIAKEKGNIEWKGSHTEFEWFIYKNDDTTPDWGGGELSINTFEEQDPATRAHLPYCWLQKNYGVSDKTMEANRHSPDKVFEPLKANLKLAQINMYKTIGPAIWNGGLTGDGGTAPVGLKWAAGNAYEGSSVVTMAAGSSYANKTLNTSAIAAYAAGRTGFDEKQWSCEALSIHEVPNTSSAKWSLYCLVALAYMEQEMRLTADLTGTGEQQSPDLAFMARSPFSAVTAKMITNQSTYGIPAQMRKEDLYIAGWNNIQVSGLTCILDNDVPKGTEATPLDRVFVLDSKQFKIKTTHTKAEGLIKNEFDENNVMINGVVGALKANMGWYLKSPTAIGVIVGCND